MWIAVAPITGSRIRVDPLPDLSGWWWIEIVQQTGFRVVGPIRDASEFVLFDGMEESQFRLEGAGEPGGAEVITPTYEESESKAGVFVQARRRTQKGAAKG